MDVLPSSLNGISLRELLPRARFVDAADIRATSCCADSRCCAPGDLFAALPGAVTDGHLHVADAIERGARAILVDRALDNVSVPQCVVANSREAYGRICQALAGGPSRRIKVIGVTGTNGKTTTSHMIASILDAAGHHAAVMGTLGFYDGVELGPSPLTTPTPPALARWLARSETNGCSHAVLEVSSHALAQARTAGIDFNIVAVTNVRHDHLDYHGTLENYRASKERILEALSSDGMAVINADDEVAVDFLNRFCGPALTVGIHGAAEISATPIEQHQSEQTFLLTAGQESIPVRIRLIGMHNIYNCLMAAAVGLAYDIDLPTIARGLESLSKMPGRLERLECGQSFGVFVDYAHTADALSNCLETLRNVTRGRLICVFGAGGDRDAFKRPLMGRAVEARSDLAVITSDNPRSEHPESIADEILQGFRQPKRARVELDRAAAIAWALEAAQPGDCVLIAGKGHEDYQIVGNDRLQFDDRELAKQWLYDHPATTPSLRAAG